MSAATLDLTAPNGTKISLPTGLFINNEFVKASSGSKITAINPRYDKKLTSLVESYETDDFIVMKLRSRQLKPLHPKMLTRL